MTVKTRIVQRSPDLGLGIKLQRLPEAPKPQKPADPLPPPAVVEPSPPWWWGRYDEDDKRLTEITSEWGRAPDAYYAWPMPVYGVGDTWVGVVEGVAAVSWRVTFTPRIWAHDDYGLNIVWTGDTPIEVTLPPGEPQYTTPARVTLPNPLFVDGADRSPEYYWYDINYTSFVDYQVPMPNVIAAGNTLSVTAETRSMSGVLEATAMYQDKDIGTLKLTLVRDVASYPISYSPSASSVGAMAVMPLPRIEAPIQLPKNAR